MKRIYTTRILALVLSAILLGTAILPVTRLGVKAVGDSDIARGKRAFSCHEESATLTPAQAVDGKSSTRFAAGGGCARDTWLVLDLEKNYDLSTVRINWEAAHPTSYVLEISSDGRTFSELKRVTNASTGWVQTTVSGTGRFLRIRELERALPQYGFSIYDLEVYGTASAEANDEAYRYVTMAGNVRYGTLTLSREGFVKEGESVTVAVSPMTGGSLVSLTYNGQDVTGDVANGKYTFTVGEDALLSAKFAPALSDRYECEEAAVLDSDGHTAINGTVLSDADASGGYVAGGTGGKYFLFENVVEANRVQIAYASTNTNSMNLYVRFPGEEEFNSAGLIHFSTSNSWNMNSSYIATSAAVYIPAGSDIMIRPNVDCNLDCLWLTNEVMADPEDAPINVVTAKDMADLPDEDIMATYGYSIPLSAYHAEAVTVPEGKDTYNVLTLSYRATESTVVSVEKGNTVIGRLTLSPTPLRTFSTAGLRTSDYAPGDQLILTCQSGALQLDYIAVNYAPEAETVTVSALPEKGDRLTVSLDGTWLMGIETADESALPTTVSDVDYVNSIPVPGLWHSAGYAFGDYTDRLTFCKKNVVLDAEPTEQVLLYIEQAQYGRHIYVNGRYVDSYHYNYSHSYTDITDYLCKGENEIVIMLGSWNSQMQDRDTPTHILVDGESTEDEPGITGSVSLIFNASPEVSAVQTKPDLEKGTVMVQVNLQNRGEKSVTTDVNFTVYELGIFENGVAKQAEKKVGEWTLPGVSVKANATVTVQTDAIALSDWSRDKCWTPDSPFLYRVEVQTAGDTFSSRFGMRTFDFDPVTKYPRLNGETFFMMGTNVAIERYYDDPLCGTTPWEESWIRKLYSEYKDVHWNAFRVHLGNANEKWFDIADEMGFMIIDEYPQWGDQDGCTLDTFMPEIYAWMDLRGNHPSLIMFDAQNEAAGNAFTDEIVRLGRSYDIQKRPWDNGWRPPVDQNDPIMGCHPYHIGTQGISGLANIVTDKPVLTMANISLKYEDYMDHPFLLEEHGEYWINREGVAMKATAGTWNSALPDSTNEQRLAYYAELMAAQIEAYRAGRAYVGILFFCGLGSSFPNAQGVTSDILAPDVSTADSLEIRPYTKELLRNAFSDLGISIGFYDEEVVRGQAVRLPITLINDTGRDISDLPITLKIMSGDTVVYADRMTMNVPARTDTEDGVATEIIHLTVPAYRTYCDSGKTLVVTASYEWEGETVYSQRKWTVERRGDFTDDAPPTYDWLVETETTGNETDTEHTATESMEDVLESLETTSEPGDTETTMHSEEDGCASVIGGGVMLLLMGVGVLFLPRRRKKE